MIGETQRHSLFSELRRRRVFRAAGVYAVVGFAFIEAGDIIFPAFSLPTPLFTALLTTTLMGFPFVILAAWVFDLTPQGLKRTRPILGLSTPTDAEQTEANGPPPPEQSIAVLPFANMSGDADSEYFSDGITEEIISALTKIPGLHVAARTSSFSFKGRNEDVTDIGRQLRVAHLLEGSVRRFGSRVRITAQLVKSADGYHLWSEVYDRELADIFAVQEEIAHVIVDKLRVDFLGRDGAPLVVRHTQNLGAYKQYLQGRFFWNQREAGVRKGIEAFEKAIASDKNYAAAYTGLADSYNVMAFYGMLPPREAFSQAKAHATRALELDPELGEAHASLAFACMLHDWDWSVAEREFLRALELQPGYATAHHWYAELLMAMGRIQESIDTAKRALELDPLGLIINTLLGMAYYMARDYPRSITACERTLELEPSYLPVYLWLGLAYLKEGRHKEAIEVFSRGRARSENRPGMTALLGYAYAASGRKKQAEQVLADLAQLGQSTYVSSFDMARIHTALGNDDTAMQQLEAAYEERAVGLVWIRVDPALDPLRSLPGFQQLQGRVDRAGGSEKVKPA